MDPAARYRDAATGDVHHASVLTGYGISPELPTGDWSSASLHLIRIDDAAADGTSPMGLTFLYDPALDSSPRLSNS
ncbi:hypothetical protein [Streptomyces sp. NPDC052107]|uniref:hypothetical protein n=1 Tax=Streptomyces sp. NPDC052107 TaxID=3155632 RepID=UPI0034338D25